MRSGFLMRKTYKKARWKRMLGRFGRTLEKNQLLAMNRHNEYSDTWCQMKPEAVGREPFDLEICEDDCQDCPVNDNCVRWVDMNKVRKMEENE